MVNYCYTISLIFLFQLLSLSNCQEPQECYSCIDKQLYRVFVENLLLGDPSYAFPSGYLPCNRGRVLQCNKKCIRSVISFNEDSRYYNNSGVFYGCSEHVLVKEFSDNVDMRCRNSTIAMNMSTFVSYRNCVCNTKKCNAPVETTKGSVNGSATISVSSYKYYENGSDFYSSINVLLMTLFAVILNY